MPTTKTTREPTRAAIIPRPPEASSQRSRVLTRLEPRSPLITIRPTQTTLPCHIPTSCPRVTPAGQALPVTPTVATGQPLHPTCQTHKPQLVPMQGCPPIRPQLQILRQLKVPKEKTDPMQVCLAQIFQSLYLQFIFNSKTFHKRLYKSELLNINISLSIQY